MSGSVASNCFIWMSPGPQADWNLEGAPYNLQILITAFAVDANGYSLDSLMPDLWPYRIEQTYLTCAVDETAESLRGKAAAFARGAYSQSDMPVTFLLDAQSGIS